MPNGRLTSDLLMCICATSQDLRGQRQPEERNGPGREQKPGHQQGHTAVLKHIARWHNKCFAYFYSLELGFSTCPQLLELTPCFLSKPFSFVIVCLKARLERFVWRSLIFRRFLWNLRQLRVKDTEMDRIVSPLHTQLLLGPERTKGCPKVPSSVLCKAELQAFPLGIFFKC